MARRPTLSRKIDPSIRRAIDALSAPSQEASSPLLSGGSATSAAGNKVQTESHPIPGPPRNVTTSGALSSILIRWDGSATTGISHYEIFSGATDNLANATLIGTSIGFSFPDIPTNTGLGQTFYYWVRGINKNNIAGAFNSAAGTVCSTSDDPEYILGLLTDSIAESSLTVALNSRISLIDTPNTGLVARLGLAEGELTSLKGEVAALNMPAFDGAVAYFINDLVSYQGNIYKCTVATTAPSPLPTNTGYWLLIGEYASLGDQLATQALAIADLDAKVTEVEATAEQTTVLAAQFDLSVETELEDLLSQDMALEKNRVNTAMIVREQIVRADEDGALASELLLLQTEVAGNTASVQTLAQSVDGIEAQYTIKTEVRTSDGKVITAGIGVLAGAGGESEILLRADRVAIVPNDLTSTETVLPFVVVDGKVYIDTALIRQAAIQAAQIDSLSAGLVNAVAINAGSVTGGVLSGIRIVSPDPGDPNPQNPSTYSALDAGNLTFYRGGQAYKYLKQIASGSAVSGSAVTLTGLDRAPEIMVSLRDLTSYMKTHPTLGDISNQNQRWEVRINDSGILNLGNGSYRFTPLARLTLGGASATMAINATLSGSGGLTSAVYTSPANATSISVNGTVNSTRGTGTSPNYYNRQCVATLYYRIAGSGSGYLSVSAAAVAHGSDFTSDSFVVSKTALAANSYEYYVVLSYSDTGATFSTGGDSYEYKTDVLTALATAVTAYVERYVNGSQSVVNTLTFPAFTPAAGFSVYEAAYKFFYAYALTLSTNSANANAIVYGPGPYNEMVVRNVAGASVSFSSESANVGSITNFIEKTAVSTSYIASVDIEAYVSKTGDNGKATANIAYKDFTITIKSRKLITNSAVASNLCTISQATYALASATVLDNTGIVNWIAIA